MYDIWLVNEFSCLFFVAMGESLFAPKHILDDSKYGILEPRMKAEFHAQKLW